MGHNKSGRQHTVHHSILQIKRAYLSLKLFFRSISDYLTWSHPSFITSFQLLQTDQLSTPSWTKFVWSLSYSRTFLLYTSYHSRINQPIYICDHPKKKPFSWDLDGATGIDWVFKFQYNSELQLKFADLWSQLLVKKMCFLSSQV